MEKNQIGARQSAEIQPEELEEIPRTEILVFLQFFFGVALILFVGAGRKKVEYLCQKRTLAFPVRACYARG